MKLAVILVVVVLVATLTEASEKIARYVRLMKQYILECSNTWSAHALLFYPIYKHTL